jgi:hypothetical protein
VLLVIVAYTTLTCHMLMASILLQLRGLGNCFVISHVDLYVRTLESAGNHLYCKYKLTITCTGPGDQTLEHLLSVPITNYANNVIHTPDSTYI